MVSLLYEDNVSAAFSGIHYHIILIELELGGNEMRIFIIRRKMLVAIACLFASCGIFYAVNYPPVVGASATTRELPIYCVERDQKIVSISFDAAWGNEDTEDLIDILEQYQVKATFFVVGDWVEKYPESVKQLSDAGHEIMNHSDNHAHYPEMSAEGVIADLNACNDKIEEITGVRPTLVRFPYGDYNDTAVRATRSIDMEPIQWDVDSLDWKDLSAVDITERVTKKVKSGSIVLFHNAAKNTPAALPNVIETLIQDGYTFVPISEILLTGEYTLNHEGRQCAVD